MDAFVLLQSTLWSKNVINNYNPASPIPTRNPSIQIAKFTKSVTNLLKNALVDMKRNNNVKRAAYIHLSFNHIHKTTQYDTVTTFYRFNNNNKTENEKRHHKPVLNSATVFSNVIFCPKQSMVLGKCSTI